MSARTFSSTILSEQFARLTGDGESSHVPLRRANLENLVETLSPWDFIHLRTLIRNKSPRLADLGDLPVELFTLLRCHLSCKDVFACAAVSKGWREACTRDLVAIDLLKLYYPADAALISHSFLPLAEPVIPSDSYAWRVFAAVVARNLTRIEGNYISRLMVSTDRNDILQDRTFHLDPAFASYEDALRSSSAGENPEPQSASPGYSKGHAYSNGRVAFPADAYSFFIDDLRTMKRTHVSPPDLVITGERDFVIQAMTDKLFILLDNASRRALIIYHLDRKEFRRVFVPNQVFKIYADKETIGMLFNYPVPPFVWRWYGGLSKLRDPTPKGVKRRLHSFTGNGIYSISGFIFHPTQSDVFYLVSNLDGGPLSLSPCDKSYPEKVQNTDDDIRRVTTSSQTDGLREDADEGDKDGFWGQVAVHKFEKLKYTRSFRRYTKFRFDAINRCRKMSDYGLYNLAVCVPTDASDFPYLLGQINFDTVNEVFLERRIAIKTLMRRLEINDDRWNRFDELQGGIAWNNQVYSLRSYKPEVEGKMRTRWLDLLGRQNAICITDDPSTLVLGNQPEFVFQGAIRSIGVDDDFIVALGEHGYTTWNFGNRQLTDDPWQRNNGLSKKCIKFPNAPRGCVAHRSTFYCFGNPENPLSCRSCRKIFRLEYMHGLPGYDWKKLVPSSALVNWEEADWEEQSMPDDVDYQMRGWENYSEPSDHEANPFLTHEYALSNNTHSQITDWDAAGQEDPASDSE